MNDEQLKSLYRRLAGRHDASLSADELAEAISRSGYPDEEGTVLDRIARSQGHADVLRVAMQLGDDATQLSRDVVALRTPVRRTPTRAWLALAAGVGAAAVVAVALRPGTSPAPMTTNAAGADAPILSASFEAASRDSIWVASFETDAEREAAPSEAQAIFDGDFDS
jgi:hypothetical protein